jgi:hypothetical protein
LPKISQFYGIIIYMYFNGHLPSHFHAEYGNYEVVYAIESLDVLRGKLPRRAHILVIEWALAHRNQLRDNRHKAREQMPLEQIEPLD